MHFIDRNSSAEIGHTLVNVEDGRTRDNNLQFAVAVVDLFQLARPSCILVYLIYEDVFTVHLDKPIRYIHQAVCGKIHVVGRHIEGVCYGQVFLDVLQQHR